MTEKQALIVVFIGTGVLAIATGAVFAVTDASGVVFGLVGTVLVMLVAYVSSEVVMHYGAVKERKKREETLLSR
jgi:hypothetical protein